MSDISDKEDREEGQAAGERGKNRNELIESLFGSNSSDEEDSPRPAPPPKRDVPAARERERERDKAAGPKVRSESPLDLFGDDDDDDGGGGGGGSGASPRGRDLDDGARMPPGEPSRSPTDRYADRDLLGDDDEDDVVDEDGVIRPRERGRATGPTLELDVPDLPRPPPSAKTFFMKLPNLFAIESRPFSAESYEDEEYLETNDADDEGKTRVTLRKDNVIRWRQIRDRNGNVIEKESNARLVRWSDGSQQLFLGSEVFDVVVQPISAAERKKGPAAPAPDSQNQNFHLFVRDGTGVVHCHGRLDKKMLFRPASLASKSHRKLTAVMQQAYGKEKKVKLIHAAKDPERDLAELEKIERDRERAQLRMEAMQRRKADLYGYDLTADFLENDPADSAAVKEGGESEEDEYDEGGYQSRLLGGNRKGYRPPTKAKDDEGSKSRSRTKRAADQDASLGRSKKQRSSDDEEEEEAEATPDEEEEEEAKTESDDDDIGQASDDDGDRSKKGRHKSSSASAPSSSRSAKRVVSDDDDDG